MNVEQLADKLRQMRTAGAARRDMDVMTRLFGVIFCKEIKEIGNNAIVEEYNRRKEEYNRRKSAEDPEKWPGKLNSTPIQDARKLAEYVDPRDDEIRKWKQRVDQADEPGDGIGRG